MAASCFAQATVNLDSKFRRARAHISATLHEGFEGFSGEGGLDDQPGGGCAALR